MNAGETNYSPSPPPPSICHTSHSKQRVFVWANCHFLYMSIYVYIYIHTYKCIGTLYCAFFFLLTDGEEGGSREKEGEN